MPRKIRVSHNPNKSLVPPILPDPIVIPGPISIYDPSGPKLRIVTSDMMDRFAAAKASGTTYVVTNAATLSAALAAAVGGDVIKIGTGVNISDGYGFTFRNLGTPSNFCFIVSEKIYDGTASTLSGGGGGVGGSRALPSLVGEMGTVQTANNAVSTFVTAPGACYYWFIGIEATINPTGTGFSNGLFQIGLSETLVSDQPHHIYISKSYIHGTDTLDTRRAIVGNGNYLVLEDSYIDNIHVNGFEAAGFGCWQGGGPFKINNNFIAAASQSVLFGGSDPQIANLIPSDMEVNHNHFYKPLAWLTEAGYTIKNHYEHKNGRQGELIGNVFQNSWASGQSGNSLLFQVLSDGNTAAWTSITDMIIRRNKIIGCGLGIVLLARVAYGTNALMPTTPLSRFLIEDLLVIDVGLNPGDSGRVLQLSGDLQDVNIRHITGEGLNAAIITDGGLGPAHNFKLDACILGRGAYGIFGNAVGEGKAALDAYMGNYEYNDNLVYESLVAPYTGAIQASVYAGMGLNDFVEDVKADVKFIDPDNGNWRLDPTSPYYKLASDGKDFGCDQDAIEAEITDVTAGSPA